MSELILVRHAQASFGEDDYDRLSVLGHQQARWLGERKSTLHELADQFGVSAERIRQLEKNAMNKLKGRLAA